MRIGIFFWTNRNTDSVAMDFIAVKNIAITRQVKTVGVIGQFVIGNLIAFTPVDL